MSDHLKFFSPATSDTEQKKLPSIFHFKALLKHHRDRLHSSSPAAQCSSYISNPVAKTGSARNMNCTFKNLITGLIVYYVFNQFNPLHNQLYGVLYNYFFNFRYFQICYCCILEVKQEELQNIWICIINECKATLTQFNCCIQHSSIFKL